MSRSEGEGTELPLRSQPWQILYRAPETPAPIANPRLPPLGQAWPLPISTILSCLFAFRKADSALERAGATPAALGVLPLLPAMSRMNCSGIASFQLEQDLSLLILGPLFPAIVAVWHWKGESVSWGPLGHPGCVSQMIYLLDQPRTRGPAHSRWCSQGARMWRSAGGACTLYSGG